MIEFPVFAFSSFTLSLSESVLLLIGLIVVAVGISMFVYRHTVPEVNRGLRYTLMTFRALALALLLFILFQPVLNLEETVTISPKVAVVFDNSKSMTIQDAEGDRSAVMQRIAGSNQIAQLLDADSRAYLMGSDGYPLQKFDVDSLTYAFSETNISNALQKAYDDLREENLRAVVLVSDGVFTRGKNPIYTAEAMGVPVFTVGVGDSTAKKDVLIGNVLAGAIAYVDNAVPVEVTVRSAGFDTGTATVTLTEGKNLIETKQIELQPGANEYALDFDYVPKSEGTKKLTVSVSPMPGELTEKNNRRSFFVKVLKTKMKVAVLAGGPSADVSLFRQVLTEDKNVDASYYIQKNAQGFYGQPPTTEALQDADCIVLLGFPTGNTPGMSLQPIRGAIEKKNIPLLILGSRTIDMQRLQTLLGSAMPVQTLQLRKNENEVFVRPVETASGNPILSSSVSPEAWKNLPPVFKTESSFKPKVGAEVLATMEMNSVAFDEPVIVTRKLNRQRVLFSSVYGIWRWQLAYDVMDGDIPELFISNAIRWLTTREDEKQVRVTPVKEFFDSAEPVEFQAQVYDESYEPVSNAAVTVKITTSAGERELVLNPLGNGFYRGAIEQLGEGDYAYTGAAAADGTEIGRDRGRFSVGEQNIEFADTRMNSTLLRQVAARTGGRYFDAAKLDGLDDAVLNQKDFTPIQNLITSDVQLWNLLPLLLLAIIFFAVEWFLRKQSGMI